MNLVIRLILLYLLAAKVIESNPVPQIGSPRGNSSLRGDTRGRGCNGHGSGRGCRQDPFDDAFACDPGGLHNPVDRPIPYVEHQGHKVNRQLALNRL